jgi:transposase
VITTSIDQKTASTAQVVGHYKALQSVERRFRVLKDFLALRPVFHYTEKRVRGHVAICVLAAVLEAVMTLELKARKLTDPDLEGQHFTTRRALRELERIRMVRFSDAEGNERQVVTRSSRFQAEILATFGVDTFHLALTCRLITRDYTT